LSHASKPRLFSRDFLAVNSRNVKNLVFGKNNGVSCG